MNKLEELLDVYGACQEARNWAIWEQKLADPAEAWQRCQNPSWLLWAIKKLYKWDVSKWHQYALFCGELVAPLLTDSRSLSALETAKRYHAGKATREELKVAHTQAGKAYSEAVCSHVTRAEREGRYIVFLVTAEYNSEILPRGDLLETVMALSSARTHSMAEVLTLQSNKIRELWGNPFKGESHE